MNIEISLAVIAIAFSILVIYLVFLILSLRKTLAKIDHILVSARRQLDDIGGETKKSLADLNQKADSFTPLFNSIFNFGQYLERKSQSLKLEAEISMLKNESKIEEQNAELGEDTEVMNRVAAVCELVGQGFRLWRDIHKRR